MYNLKLYIRFCIYYKQNLYNKWTILATYAINKGYIVNSYPLCRRRLLKVVYYHFEVTLPCLVRV